MTNSLASQIQPSLIERLVQSYHVAPEPLRDAPTSAIPSAIEVRDILEDLREVLFPGWTDGSGAVAKDLRAQMTSQIPHLAARLERQIDLACRCGVDPAASSSNSNNHLFAPRVTQALLHELPGLRAALIEDANAAMAGDPAARSLAEVLLCYPGHYAITAHRLAHILWKLDVPLLPRMISERAHRMTGIDIHPGAVIGPAFFIDHGTGVVIGETAIIGANVRMYQGVTLGALSLPAHKVIQLRNGPKRHPTLEDDVIVYAAATILGGQTVIGKGSVIGGNCWIVRSVPAQSRITVAINTASTHNYGTAKEDNSRGD